MLERLAIFLRSPRFPPLALAFAVYLAAAALLGGWLIDDAGLSFAYARNLAQFDGLVSQPGRAPVEGFSNFLWVLLLVPSFWTGLFHAVATPKLLGAALMLTSFALVQWVFRRRTGREWPGAAATLLLATAPPLVIWSTSGLENSLTLALAVLLWTLLSERPHLWASSSGVVAALLALTRPDGVVFVLAAPLLCLAGLATRRESLRDAGRSVGLHLTAFGAVYGPFLAFRYATFGLPNPHTYYAKRMHSGHWEHLQAVLAAPGALFTKAWDLGRGVAGPVGPWLLLAALGAFLALAVRRRVPRPLAAAAALQGLGAAAFLWLDDDWMGEYRFATVAVAFSLVTLTFVAAALVDWLGGAGRRRAALAVAGIAGCVLAQGFLPRITRFASAPPTPLADVRRGYAARFDAYAARLKVDHPSVLLADVGATLLESNLRVYDLAGLCEPAVVQKLRRWTQYWQPEHPEFNDWVFDEVKPTFISTRQFWTLVTRFEDDGRFARDYAAIDAVPDEYLRQAYGVELRSGDFVRWDALGGPAALDEMRASYVPLPRPEPLVNVLADALDPPQDVWAAAVFSFEQGDPNRAAALFGRLLEVSPQYLAAARARALSLDRAGRLGEARLEWQRVASLAAGPAAASLIAAARERLGDPTADWARAEEAKAMEAGVQALYRERDPARAVEAFARLLQKNPNHYGANFQLAMALEQANRTEEAVGRWARVRDLAVAAKDPATEKTAREHLDAAVAALMQNGLALLYEKKLPAEAAQAFQRVLSLVPSHYGATYQLAVALDRAGQEEAALKAWAQVVPLAESFADAATLAAARARLVTPK